MFEAEYESALGVLINEGARDFAERNFGLLAHGFNARFCVSHSELYSYLDTNLPSLE
jgi:hypothetical protein